MMTLRSICTALMAGAFLLVRGTSVKVSFEINGPAEIHMGVVVNICIIC